MGTGRPYGPLGRAKILLHRYAWPLAYTAVLLIVRVLLLRTPALAPGDRPETCPVPVPTEHLPQLALFMPASAGDSYAAGPMLYDGHSSTYYSNTCRASQELVRVTRNHLPADVFEALKSALLAQLAARATQMPRDQNSCLFCVHVVFNVNGVRQLRDHPSLGFLYAYFERVRRRDMNAWDISVTMVHGSSNAEAFRPHYDRTLTDHMKSTANVGGLKVVRRWEYGLLSDTSSVTYVQVPTDIQGGGFRFWDPREYDWSIIHSARVPPPTRIVKTEENMMVEFRGDAMHGLEGFTTATGLPRVSLVAKQYKLSPGDYAFTPDFLVVS